MRTASVIVVGAGLAVTAGRQYPIALALGNTARQTSILNRMHVRAIVLDKINAKLMSSSRKFKYNK